MKKYNVEFRYALIYVFMTLIWSLIGKLLGFHDRLIGNNLVFNFLIVIPSFAVYYLALREKKRKEYHGLIKFKQAFLSGVMMTVFITILAIITPIVTTQLISPDYFSNSISYVVNSGKMTAAEARSQFNLPAFIFQGIIAAPVFGIILSALAAFLVNTKSKKQLVSYGN